MAFSKIEFCDHGPEWLNKKVHSHPYYIYPELGRVFQPCRQEYMSLKSQFGGFVNAETFHYFFPYKKINLTTSRS